MQRNCQLAADPGLFFFLLSPLLFVFLGDRHMVLESVIPSSDACSGEGGGLEEGNRRRLADPSSTA